MESRGSTSRGHEFTTSVLELDEGKKRHDKRNPIAVVPFILGDCPARHSEGDIVGLSRHCTATKGASMDQQNGLALLLKASYMVVGAPPVADVAILAKGPRTASSKCSSTTEYRVTF